MSGRDPLGAVEQTAIAEEIVSTVRHDMRNRFAIIRNALFYIQRKVAQAGVKDARMATFFKLIDDEAVAASALLDDPVGGKLRFCRRVARTSAAGCIQTAVACARIDTTVIRAEVDAGEGDVDVDPGELALAVRCLLENAAESMPGGGVVALRGSAAGERYLIEITDAGVGVPPSDHDAIAAPFFTTKPGHVGLGLNIVRRVAQHHSGALTVRANDKGTSAVIDLPLAAPEGASSP